MTTQRDEALMTLLGSLVESAGLVQAATGCVMRWGLTATDARGSSNRDNLLRELDDMKGSIKRLEKVLLPSSMLPSLPANEPTFACGMCGCAGEFYEPWDLCEHCGKAPGAAEFIRQCKKQTSRRAG